MASPLPVYRGEFSAAQAERLLWRAGFGPKPGDVERTAQLGLDRAVDSLTRPGPQRLVGPAPRDDKGRALAPFDVWGHDHLWWLDRMVRTTAPLVERMALVWHDWFATSNDQVNSQRLMIRQNELFRRRALGSFEQLLLDVTHDPAMLVFLNGNDNRKDAPNENYGRELMELFTLGADRGAYSERDVREQARALSGWAADWRDGVGWVDFRYEAGQHDGGQKTVFGKRGAFDWQDACRLCLADPKHPSFFVRKLWSYFVPVEPDAATQRGLERLYTSGRYEVRPVLQAILRHPTFYEGPRMTKPPVVFTAGLLRALRRPISTDSWAWIGELCGQRLFAPPSVAGWDDGRWLDTATFRGRWIATVEAIKPLARDPEKARAPHDAEQLVGRGLQICGNPTITASTRAALAAFAEKGLAAGPEP